MPVASIRRRFQWRKITILDNKKLKISSAFLFLVFMTETAFAYIGPGAGLTVIGTVIALIGTVVLAIVGFIWYPIKRMRARSARKSSDTQEKTSDESDNDEKNE